MDRERLPVLMVCLDEDEYYRLNTLLEAVPHHGEGPDGSGIELEWTDSFKEALGSMKKDLFSAYLVDNQLGDRDGLALLHEAMARGCRAPILLLSERGDRGVDITAMKIGAADFLVKSKLDGEGLERSIRYAVQRSHQFHSLIALAVMDELTQLCNRRELRNLLEKEIIRSRRFKHPMTVIMLDIDQFKQVNDRYGHSVGDEALRWISQLLQSNIRSVDLVGRYGGDEFAVIFPETYANQAYIAAERLRQKVAAEPFRCPLEGERPVEIALTISLGISEYPVDGLTGSQLIDNSDQALYVAKNLGRNCTVLAKSKSL